MITIEEIPVDKIDDFWKIHIGYLVDDEIITDPEDIEYFKSGEYRDILKSHMLRKNDKHHMVYFVKDKIKIGAAQYTTYQSEDGKCFIMDFWVFEKFRGNGTGHACFDTLKNYAAENDATFYALNYSKERSHKFWLSCGFADDGVDEYDMPVMIKR